AHADAADRARQPDARGGPRLRRRAGELPDSPAVFHRGAPGTTAFELAVSARVSGQAESQATGGSAVHGVLAGQAGSGARSGLTWPDAARAYLPARAALGAD